MALVVALLCSMLPQLVIPANAAAEHVLDAAQIDCKVYSAVYGEKMNQILRGEVALFSNSDDRYVLGSSMRNSKCYTIAGVVSGYQCYIYAQGVYYYLFGDVIHRGDGNTYWSNSEKVLYNEKTASFELFFNAKVGFGAYIRTTTSSSGAFNGNEGHSMIVLGYTPETITYLEGNGDGKGLIRICTRTWDEFNELLLTSKGRRISHVVQCKAAICPHTDCTELGVCRLCGETFNFANTFRSDCEGYYTVSNADGVFLKTDMPYEAAPNSQVCVPGDVNVEILGRVTNGLGETWYQLSWDGQIGYANAEHFTFVGYGEQEIQCILTSPEEGAVVPRASYPVIGEVTSGYYLQEVVGELDGEVFATVLLGNMNHLDIRASDINQKLSFSKLDPGPHTLVIRARDIHHEEWLTVCTRHFITEGTPTVQLPEKPILRYTQQEESVVFDWAVSSDATHYALHLQSQDADGQWQHYTIVEEAVSGLSMDLPAGEYSAQLMAYYTQDEAQLCMSSDEVYLTVIPNHVYVLQSVEPATCTQAGREDYACEKCGDSYFIVVPETEHQYEDNRCTVCDAVEDATYSLKVVSDEKTGKPVLNWNTVDQAKKYEIYRATSENGKYTRLTTITKTTYTDTKATAGTQYFYKIRVSASASCAYNGVYSEVIDCWTTCARPAVTIKIDTASGKPSLSWSAVTKATKYRILRRLPGEDVYTVVAETQSKTYLDSQVPADTICQYQVQAVGSTPAMDSAYSAVLQATAVCGRPVLKASANDDGKPIITWGEIADAVAYKVYRSTSSGKGYTVIDTVEENAYTDMSAATGKTYYYKVVAVAQQTESATSSYVKAQSKCAVPEMTLEQNEAGKPVLSWNQVPGAKKYEIYRSVDGGSFKKLTTTTKTTYTNTGASGGTACAYKVRALGSSSSYNSAFCQPQTSNVRCATPVLTAKIDTNTGLPNLSWGKVTGAASYQIYRSTNGGEYTLIATQTARTYKDTKVQPGTVYSYAVVAAGKKGVFNSLRSSEKTVTAVCGIVKLKGKIGTEGKPVLVWSAVDQAESYGIYRSTSKSSGYVMIDQTEELTYTDFSAPKSKTYYYKVVALAGGTQSTMSGYMCLKATK